MGTYIARRFFMLAPVLVVVGVVVFLLIHLTPGDPATAMLGEEASGAQIAALRQQLGLNDPLYVQFARWSSQAVRLNFGQSLFLQQSVTQALLSRAQPTGLLTLYALIISILVGFPAGILAAVHQNTLLDRLLTVLALAGAAVPGFFLGILLILLFAVRLHWLPSGGYAALMTDPAAHFKAMILPAFSLGFAHSALLARVVRSSMLDVLHADYIRTAQAKGLANRAVVMRHALRNALLPAITIVGNSLGALLGGAVITETVFTIPGMGLLVIQSINRRDYPIIQGAVMCIALVYVLVNLLVDVLYAFIDPRIRYGRS
jgi:peptide/nickel transport system permease protein